MMYMPTGMSRWVGRTRITPEVPGAPGTSGVIRVRPTQRDMPVGIYIIDPLGNLVFFYPVDAPPEDVLKDLKRLLKVSQIG